MLYKKKTILFVLLSVLFMVPVVSAQDIVVIANSDVVVNEISASDVKKIFLGKKIDWENGNKITFFASKQDTTQKKFLKTYIGKSTSQFKRFWKKQMFSGKTLMPLFSVSDENMVTLVTGKSGSIGFITAESDLGNAKILSIK